MNNQMSIDKIIQLVTETHPYARGWKRSVTADWIAFFMVNGFIAAVSEGGPEIDGLCLFRPVITPADGADNTHLSYDPEGSTIWIDYCYSNSKRAMRGLGLCVLHRLGHRPYIAWERRGQLTVWPAKHFEQRILPKEKYVTTSTSHS